MSNKYPRGHVINKPEIPKGIPSGYQPEKGDLDKTKPPQQSSALADSQESKVAGMEFEDALKALKSDKTVTNRNWNGKGMCLKIQYPDENSKMNLPYIYMVNSKGENVPWLASQQDMFSNGWKIVGE